MRVLLAFDKFKDALSAHAACTAAAAALREQHPDWQLDLCPLTDGGEGFGPSLVASAGGEFHPVRATGPRGRPVDAAVGLVLAERIPAAARALLGVGASARVGIVEMAAASGLALLPPAERDPWQASTTGTGELLRAAAGLGAELILMGIGGSATSDLGTGALAALGVGFLDDRGTPINPPAPATWSRVSRLASRPSPALPPIRIACDVTNPLLGPQGAAAVFGPQKGLLAEDLPRFDAGAARMADRLCDHFGVSRDLRLQPGTGAAGGIGFGLMAATGATLLPGFALVSAWLDLPTRVAAADLVVTGEGIFDATSLLGKGPGSLALEAHRAGKRVAVFAGRVDAAPGFPAHAITPPGLPLAEALPRTAELLADAVRRNL